MLNKSWRYGIFCGLFLSLIFFLSYAFGPNPFIDFRQLLVDSIIIAVFLWFGMLEYKRLQEGVLHFWQGMTIGFFIYGIATIVFGMFLIILFVLEKNLLADYVSEALVYLQERSDTYVEEFGEDQYQSQIESIKAITARELTLSSSVKKLIAGLFVTPVISIILRKQPK